MKGQWKEWQPGDPVLINRIVWGKPELDQMQAVLDNDWFGPGAKVVEFGLDLEHFTKIKYCQLANSGSSALMLAVQAMLELGLWKRGDWILHPVLTFPTSIAPAIQSGLVPLFVDADPYTYQIDLDQAARAMETHGDKIAGAIIPHLLGNICDMDQLLEILDGRPLIEDCCDTLGGYYGGKHVGSFGRVAAFSFYGSHHVTTAGVGGALMTNNEKIYDFAKSATHWGRNDYSKITDRYERFSRRYWYETLGYDYQMTELQAAFGIVQLGRLAEGNKLRSQRFSELSIFFDLYEDFFCLPLTDTGKAQPSWFAYPLTIRQGAPFSRKEFVMYLIENKIEIRPLFTGNIMRHPALVRLNKGKDEKAMLFGASHVADWIGDNALFLPAWGMSDGEMAYVVNVLESFLGRYRRPQMGGVVKQDTIALMSGKQA